FIKTGIASWADIAGGSHCMSPRYLENQLEQSLVNMNLSCSDVYYVHNPESQLSAVSHDEFWRRLRAAFEFLEQSVASGKIKNYGVATWNGFRAEPDSQSYHSLESIRHSLGSLASDAQAGIQFVRSAPGITTALVGMSHEAHVEENLELARVPPASADALLSVFDQEE